MYSFSFTKDLLKSPKLINIGKLSTIADISCGDGYFMILEREDVLPFERWSEVEVYDWFKEMELDDYLNIIKYHKITGLDLFDADELYFFNKMGMEDDIISKVKYEINRLKKNTSCKTMNLWGCGTNKNGQLAQMDYEDNFLKTLTKINLPEMKADTDYIVSIKCHKNFSVFITKFAEIYITGNYSMKNKFNLANQNNINNNINTNNTTHSNQGHNKDRNKKSNKDRKDSSASMNKNSVIKANNKWVNITKRICFDVLKENNNYDDIRQYLLF